MTAVIGFSSTAMPVMADEETDAPTFLDAIVVSGSRTEEKLLKTPTAISLIDNKELNRVKFIDGNKELLSRIPGNSMIRNLRFAFGGKNYTVNLRDGVMTTPFGSGTSTAINQINPWDIERVEVLKGPASALYGSNAVGGVVNIITKAPPEELEVNYWGELGSWGRVREGISIGDTVGDFGYKVDINGVSLDGWQDRSVQTEKNFTAKGVWQASEATKVTLRGEYQDIYSESPGGLTQAEFDTDWRQAHNPNVYTNNEYLTLSGMVEHRIDDVSKFKLSYAMRKSYFDGETSYGGPSDNVDVDHNMALQYDRDLAFLSSKWTLGSDLQYSDSNDIKLDVIGGTMTEHWHTNAKVASPFTQWRFSPLDWMEVSLGARYDNIHYTGVDLESNNDEQSSSYGNISKKAGITFKLNEKNSLWLSYGEGFVVPSSTYLYKQTVTVRGGRPSGYYADPNLEAEKAVDYSIGLRGSLMDGMFGYDTAIYHTTIKDMVVGVDRGGALTNRVYTNAGEVKGSGVETELHFVPTDWVRFDVAHTYADHYYSDFVDSGTDYTGNQLSASPLHHINGRVTVSPKPGLDVELELDHISSYYTSTDNADPDGEYKRPDLLHLKVDYETGPWSIWGQVRNVTDTKYAERVSYSDRSGRSYTAGEPTSFNIGVKYSF